MIIIEHALPGETVATVMGHLRSSGLNVSVGQFVTKGYLLGYVGNSSQNGGWAPHIHYGVNKGSYSGDNALGCDGKWVYAGYAADSCVQSDWYDPTNFNGAHATHYQPFAGYINGDSYGDIGLRDFNDGVFYIRYGDSGSWFSGETQYAWGAVGAHLEPFTADFDTNGCGDIGLRDANDGKFYFRYGNCLGGFGGQTDFPWGAAGYHYKPLVCDVNADGKPDIGLRDPNDGGFYFRYGPSFASQTQFNWAVGAHYQPFARDFNNDNKCDIGLRDPNDGRFYILFGNGSGLWFGNQIIHEWAPGYHYAPFTMKRYSYVLGNIGLKDPNNGVWYIRFYIGGDSFCCETQYPWAPG